MASGESLSVQARTLPHAVVLDLLQSGQSVRLAVSSSSMRPLLRRGDWVEVQPIALSELGLGDIVLILAENQLISHRVVKIDRDTIQTKGDAALYADTPVAAGQVLGVIRGIVRGEKSIQLVQPAWQFVNRLAAQIGRWEDAVWRRFHPTAQPESLRKIMDMINWLLRLPMRSVLWISMNVALWID